MDHVTAGEVVTRELLTVSLETAIASAACHMLKHWIGGIPFMEGESPVRTITDSDVLWCFLGQLEGSIRSEGREPDVGRSEAP